MSLLTQTAFAARCGVSRQAVSKAVKSGLLKMRDKKIDPDDYQTIKYEKSLETRRDGIGKKIIKATKKAPKKKGKKPVKDEVVQEQPETISITVPKKNGHTKEVEELLALAHRLEQAKTEKMEQQAIAEKLKNAKLRGELLTKESIYNNLFMYLDKLHSNIERLADSFLSDVGGRIVDAGRVLPEYRSQWKNEVMSQIHESKTTIVNNIKALEKE